MPREAHFPVISQQPLLRAVHRACTRSHVMPPARSSSHMKHATPQRVSGPPHPHLPARSHMVSVKDLAFCSHIPRPPFQLHPQNLRRAGHLHRDPRGPVATRSRAVPDIISINFGVAISFA
eukprot:7548384-Pyramimonas_sp.AAC.1